MSLFEDVLEAHYNATERIEGPRTVETLERAIEENIHDADDLSIVADWHTLHHMEHDLMDIELDLDLPEEITARVPKVERDHYYELGETNTRTVTVQPGWELLRSAFRTANAAVAELGLELDIDDSGSDVWEFREIEDVDDIDPDEWDDLSVFENGNGADA